MITVQKEKKEAGYEWVDVTNPTKAELSDLAVRFGLPGALAEDSLLPEHLPKYEKAGEIEFIILRLLSSKASLEADTIQEVTDKIAVFIGLNFILTIHRQPYEFLEEIKSKFVDTGKCTTRYELLFRVIAQSMSTFEAPLAALVEELDFYEPKIFLRKKTPSLLQNLYYIKRRASVIDHIIELSKVILKNLKEKITAHHFNRLKGEFLQMQTGAKQVVDNVSNLLNIYISLSSQRTNEVVRVLTLFSVFFMPLTFVAGIYGMNFDVMPELRWQYGYLYAMLFMVMMSLTIYLWFRRKGWL